MMLPVEESEMLGAHGAFVDCAVGDPGVLLKGCILFSAIQETLDTVLFTSIDLFIDLHDIRILGDISYAPAIILTKQAASTIPVKGLIYIILFVLLFLLWILVRGIWVLEVRSLPKCRVYTG